MFPSSLAGAEWGLTRLASEAECGQGQQGEEHAGPHGVSEVALRLLLGLRCSHQPPAPFILWDLPWRPGWATGDSARAIWGHPPQIYRPNPKGCCGWNQGSLAGPWEWRRRWVVT